jgi:hypothetical protein
MHSYVVRRAPHHNPNSLGFKKRFLDPPANSTNERHISARRRLDEQASLPSQREESEKKTRESQVFVDLVLLALSVIEP